MDKEEKESPRLQGLDPTATSKGSKGKGKQTSTEASSTSPFAGQTFVSRVSRSATALTKDLVDGRTNASNIKQVIPTNKRSSDASANATTSAAAGFAGTFTSGSASSHVPADSDSSFKTSDTQSHVAQQESAFSNFLDGIPILEPPTEAASESLLQGDSLSLKEHQQQTSPPFTLGSRSDDNTPIQDGLAVLELLESGAYDEVMTEVAEEPILNPEEERSLRRALFVTDPGDSMTKGVDWNDLLNFIPSYIASDDLDRQHERMGHMGTSEPGDVHRIWVEQWQDVLTRYTGEVWGDLGLLVRKAQEELQQAESGPMNGAGPSDFPALRRLQQVLGHVRGH